jgi:predicted dehydrogenase
MDKSHSHPVSTPKSGQGYGLGLVGAGAFGEFCLDAYGEMEDISIIAVADIDFHRAQKLAPDGVKAYRDYQSMLNNSEVEIVAINTPPHLHGEMVRLAAEAGKHIFVEKPFALSLEEAYKAAEAVHSANVQIGINYVLRHHPIHKITAEIVHSQALGKFQHWSLENFASDDSLTPDHWIWDLLKSGGILVEHGVHFFDLCNHFAGRNPTEVSGNSQKRSDGRTDRTSGIVKYGDEILATFFHSFNQIGFIEQTTIRVDCTRGHIVIEGWIPTRLDLHGLVDREGLTTLKSLFKDRIMINNEFQDTTTMFQHGGVTEQINAEVSVQIEIPNRQEEYQRAIQTGMKGLIAAINRDHSLNIGLDDAILSLAVALAARDGGSEKEFSSPDWQKQIR